MADVKITDLPAYPTGQNPGANDVLPIVDIANNITRKIPFSAFAGGGGGGAFTSVVARWTSTSTATKDAFTAPGVINNDGITIALTASSNPGTLPTATVSLNGTALTNSYTIAGTFPNYTITIPVADITGTAPETAATVTVGIVIGTQFNLSANNLINTQPVPFTTILSASYAVTGLPFYTTTASVNWSYSNSGAITSFGGTLSPGGNATAPTGTFNNVAITGITIGGSATGFGTNGAGTSTVTLSGSVPAVPTWVPAFYQQTANATPPTWATTTAQTPGSQIGATITYPAATATTQFDWIATTQPASKVLVVSTFGNFPATIDVTATASIGGTTFNVFGITALTVGQALQLIVSA